MELLSRMVVLFLVFFQEISILSSIVSVPIYIPINNLVQLYILSEERTLNKSKIHIIKVKHTDTHTEINHMRPSSHHGLGKEGILIIK